MSRKEIKEQAKKNLNGKWGGAIIIFLIYLVITAGISATGIGILFSSVLTIAMLNAFLKGRSQNDYNPSDMFEPLNYNLTNKILLSIIKNIYIFLWTLLFIVPGIVKTYAYALSEYLSIRHPDWEYKKCLQESQNMMKGHKFELFMLQLSFLGWDLLSVFTLGILQLYIAPYKFASLAIYYEQLEQNYTSVYNVE
ncbi:MAG: DUF975 family protein [Bacilli bacterium]|nr:DUF975 family protein [Bacillales bacterium]MDY2574714.1 DUF975 family protein [Bacilli bacterium]